MLSKAKNILVTIMGSIIAALVVVLQTLRLKQTKKELKREKSKSESITRQIKANREQKLKAWDAIHEAKSKTNTVSDINRVLRKRSRRT